MKAQDLGDYAYKIRREDNKWHITPILDWEMKFGFFSPYTLFDAERRFRKAINAGPWHVSLIPGISREKIEINIMPSKKHYFLHKKDSVQDTTELEFFSCTTLSRKFYFVI